MKIFKSIDDKFEAIGFKKIDEDCYGVMYEREVPEFKFIQVLDLIHKSSGNHIVQSYDKNLRDTEGIGNTCVGLTMYEMKLCLKKMKKIGWKVKKN